jgi:small subunit ribosomal protein S3
VILEHDPMAQDKRLETSGQSRARANANQRGPASGAQASGA